MQRKIVITHKFYENSLILAVNDDQKLRYWFYSMQILAAAKGFTNNYYYQLDSLKLSRDQKQNFNRGTWNITL